MVGQRLCTICNRHVYTHSYKLRCSICTRFTYLNCQPNVNRDDRLYIDRESNDWYCSSCMKKALRFNHFDDDVDFINALIEPANGKEKLFSLIEKQHLNVNDNANYMPENPLSCTDPDMNFFNDQNESLESCKYYSEESFTNMCAHNYDKSKCLSLMHVNIRSVQANYGSLSTYVHSLNHTFDVIGLSETWLNKNTVNNFKPLGYNAENLCRENKSGGGVSILINESLHFKTRNDLSVNCPEVECLFVEIPSLKSNKSHPNVIVGSVYRPPNTSIKDFNETISRVLSCIKRKNKTLLYNGGLKYQSAQLG